jgi:hypothetical protein
MEKSLSGRALLSMEGELGRHGLAAQAVVRGNATTVLATFRSRTLDVGKAG